MTHEEIKKLEENTEKYKKVLALVYADGDVSSVERNRLISLKNELGLSDSLCIAMESHFHETADLDKIKWEKLKEIHHCSLCHPDGSIHWKGINHSMLEYIEAGDTYIEASNGSSYTGLSEPFALSIGQSFEELLNEYGKIHIYDAIDDGKLGVFDEYKDLETYLKLRFDIRDEETLKNDYEKLLNQEKLEVFTDKNIWETEETNAITAYMPSGITSKEIEIIENFLTRHRDIPTEQRVEFLKLKDTLEEINERLVAKEERQTELERGESTSVTRSEKEVIDDYISKVKENLSSSRKNAVEEVFESSKIALKNFSDNEKKIIGQYLFDNGAKDQKSLGNLLKKKVEPEHNHEINRDIERGR